jgi:ABC-type antimicrobial peptide transport system permease subunit
MQTVPAIEQASALFLYDAKIVVNSVQSDGLVARFSPSLSSTLGLQVVHGRFPTIQEVRAKSAVVVSQDFWRSSFAGKSLGSGAAVAVDGQTYLVVGVLPERVPFPFNVSVWLPAASDEGLSSLQYRSRVDFSMYAVMRLKSGMSGWIATTVANQLAAQFDVRFGSTRFPYMLSVSPLRPDPLGIRDYHVAMLAAAAALLLLACANVAALFLARGNTRRREYAIRLACGASRAHIALLILGDVLLITVAGGLLGLVVGIWTAKGLTTVLPNELLRLGLSEPDWSVRIFIQLAVLVACVSVVAAALPLWQAARVQPAEPLKDSSPSATRRSGEYFRMLVMGEIALSLTLLIAAALVAKGTRNILRFDFGYDARPLIAARFHVPRVDSISGTLPTERAPEFAAMVRNLPGIVDAAVVRRSSTEGHSVTSDQTIAGGAALTPTDDYLDVDSHFLSTLGLKIVDGRNFQDGDRAVGGAAILDQRAAHILFPTGHAVGSRVKMGGFGSKRAWLRVVGIVAPGKMEFPRYPDLELPAQVFTSDSSLDKRPFEVVARPFQSTIDVARDIRLLRGNLPTGSYVSTTSWIRGYEPALLIRQFIMHEVSQRTREFAVRVALGAGPKQLLKLFTHSAIELVLGGTAVGAFSGMWSGYLLQEYLFGVYPFDAQALVFAEGVLAVAMALACLWPAVQTMRVNSVDIMRSS